MNVTNATTRINDKIIRRNGVRLINEENNRLGGSLDLVNYTAEPLLKFALHARAGLEQPNIERAHGYLLK